MACADPGVHSADELDVVAGCDVLAARLEPLGRNLMVEKVINPDELWSK
jgi:hypothetical protein